MRRIFYFLVAIATSAAFTSCQNDVPEKLEGTSPTEKILSLPSGDVLFDGSQFIFQNSAVYDEYLRKLALDPSLSNEIEEKYADILLAGQVNNHEFDKPYLFSKLTPSFNDILNKDGKVIIGDYAIKFDSIYQFSVPVKHASLLNSIDLKNLDSKVFKNEYGRVAIGKSNLRTEINLNGATGKANRQSPIFYYQSPDPYAGQPTKYVNELVATVCVPKPQTV